jgi:hypothetical protein
MQIYRTRKSRKPEKGYDSFRGKTIDIRHKYKQESFKNNS